MSYGYQPSRDKQVTQSMISTVSEAFQFEDFLGETTTLKDRVPKNKADPNKKIIHFSRQVTVDYAASSNALSSYSNQTTGFPKSNTFDTYMNSDTYSKPFFTDITPTQTYQQPQRYKVSNTYNQTSNYGSYETPKYNDYSSYSYKKQTIPVNNYSSPPINQLPSQKQLYTSNLNSSGSRSYRQPQNKPNSDSFNNSYQSTYQSYQTSSSGSRPSFENNKPTTPSYNFVSSNYSYKQPTTSFNKYENIAKDEWSSRPYSTPNNPPPTFSNASQNNSNYNYNTNYHNNTTSNNQPQSYSSKTNYQPYKAPQPVQSNYSNPQGNSSYSQYGQYSKDFSSSDIMAILNRRKK